MANLVGSTGTVGRTGTRMRRGRRATVAILAAGLALSAVLAGPSASLAAAGKASIPAVRAATNRYHDINAAFADGYVIFYQCTEQPGVGTMGQHLVKPSLVGDPAVDPLHPEVLVYEPMRDGGWKLVAVEYVTLDTSSQPWVLGQPMNFRAQGNRYGLPDFYELHAWIWQGNPRGQFDDWNPDLTCLGAGDNGG
jgi:hypothetical protein